MTITTTLTWTRYDGTPETLPEKDRLCLVSRVFCGVPTLWQRPHYIPKWAIDQWDDGSHGMGAKVGDTWAYWPEAPEVEA